MGSYVDFLDKPIFKIVGESADRLGMECYVVGGYVRDGLMNRLVKMDLDFVTVGSGIALRKRFEKKNKPKLSVKALEQHMNAQGVDLNLLELEKRAQQEQSKSYSEKHFGRRSKPDFTINAMAICLNKEKWGELIDPFNGRKDLENKNIQTPLNPNQTFDDDPLRMMRAIRFAAQLDFRIEAGTLNSIRDHSSRIHIVAPERIAQELNKLMSVEKPSYGLGLLFTSGIMNEILPKSARYRV